MGYMIANHLDEGWIRFIKIKSTDKTLDSYIIELRIDLDDYWILKSSDRFRFISIDEIYNYAGIICFRKDFFNKEDIDRWLKFTYHELYGLMKYLSMPFPTVELLNKIKIVEWDME